ncbi:MAG: tetratricopeptide repeat protein [Gemmatimonadales bacterium]|nr:tetratricopeptide repeat protein [Gemmatimonadales bacterium]MDG2241566.1 tetratricopeptide repeat protein [Longimicrobiales bacterium]MBT3773846.1 tetratricopeptide repeat protein [Gemmatimonadales bacterium]MBT3959724.1 tetratricopeptide repeat protein [Gemmatimonadales bacterium]MBT4438168.1 tetratricopeptide repeat protein [Gemmatimonadales bacterium]
MATPTLDTRQLLAKELSRTEPEMDLARAFLLVAKEEYPQLSVELYLARLDQLAEEVKDRLADETAPLIVLSEVVDTLYRRRKFNGNREAYYDPRNSFLNDVLDRGTGVPLTLGVVLLEVGWRLGLPLEGVSFPGHFLIRFNGEAMDLLLDPFDGGKARFEDEAQELLDRVYGGMVRLQDAFMKTADRRNMIVRLLTNLKGVYVNVGDNKRALAAVERILMVTPTAPAENRTRGVLLARLGRRDEAAEQLERYLRVSPSAADSQTVSAMLKDLREGRDLSNDVGAV